MSDSPTTTSNLKCEMDGPRSPPPPLSETYSSTPPLPRMQMRDRGLFVCRNERRGYPTFISHHYHHISSSTLPFASPQHTSRPRLQCLLPPRRLPLPLRRSICRLGRPHSRDHTAPWHCQHYRESMSFPPSDAGRPEYCKRRGGVWQSDTEDCGRALGAHGEEAWD